jgi:hypothetical protein
MRKTCLSAPWGVPGAAALGWGFGVQECDVPVLVSVVVAAKSFVFPRWSDLIFSRPHKLFRGLISQLIRFQAAPNQAPGMLSLVRPCGTAGMLRKGVIRFTVT